MSFQNYRTYIVLGIVLLVVGVLFILRMYAGTLATTDAQLLQTIQVPPSWPTYIPFPQDAIMFDASIEEIKPGRLSHVAIYNSLRSPNDILQLYRDALQAEQWVVRDSPDLYLMAERDGDYVTVQVTVNGERVGSDVMVTADIAK